jgi:hypothetical protein
MLPHLHVQRTPTGWLLPADVGSWGVRLTASGIIQLIWCCSQCDYRSSPVPHYLAESMGIPNIRSLPTISSYAGLFGRCIVHGCESDEVELNHFAPRAIFGQDAENWPTGYLCVRHHREWGERVTPQLNRRRVS